MGKFQKQLDSLLVPEWRDTYCSYEKLKNVASAIASGRSTGSAQTGSEGVNHPTHSGLLRALSLGMRSGNNSGIFHNRSRTNSPSACIQVSVGEEDKDHVFCTMMLPPIARDAAEVEFFAQLDKEVNKVNAFYIQKEEEFVSQAEHLQKQLKAMLEMREALCREQQRMGAEDCDSRRPWERSRKRSGEEEEERGGIQQAVARAEARYAVGEGLWRASPGKVGAASGAIAHPVWERTGVRLRSPGMRDHVVAIPPSPGQPSPSIVGKSVGGGKGRGLMSAAEEEEKHRLGRGNSKKFKEESRALPKVEEDEGDGGGSRMDVDKEVGSDGLHEEKTRPLTSSSKLPVLQTMRMDLPATTPVATINRLSKVLWGDLLNRGTGDAAGPTSFKLSARKVRSVERLLDTAVREFYRAVYLLKSFSSLNMEAFGKVLTKHDKVSQWKVASVYMSALEGAHFHASTKVGGLVDGVETWYMEFFADSSRDKAMEKLRPRKARASHTVTFFLGLCGGGIIALLACFFAVLAVAGGYRRAGGPSYIEAVVPVFSVVLLLTVHIFMYGVNLYWWREARINYAFIFEFAPGTELRYRQVLLVASGLLLFVLGCMVTHLALHTKLNDINRTTEFIPLVTILVPLVLLFLPFRVIYYSSRVFFLRTMWHNLVAPWYKVTLPDFFLGDQLTSQVPLLRNMQYVVCYYAGAPFLSRNKDECLHDVHYKRINAFIGVLPFFLRFLQCGRRWLEEKNGDQIGNAFKYFSAMVAVALRIQYAETGTGLWLCIMVSMWATAFAMWWDIVKDWGLLNLNSKNALLRDNLALSRKWVYFAAMLLNLLLRFAWIDSIMMWKLFGWPRNLVIFLMASLEIIRRGVWNFFRLENEHLNNVGKFRAVRAVPLPFINEEDE